MVVDEEDDINDEIEDDIDFDNIVERRIMEIVEEKGIITLDEYIECLKMDPDVNIDELLLQQKHIYSVEYMSSVLRSRYMGFDVHAFYAGARDSSSEHELREVSFELSCYITLACVGGFLSMIPIPPINGIGGYMFGTAMTAAGTILFHEYCERREKGEFGGSIDWDPPQT